MFSALLRFVLPVCGRLRVCTPCDNNMWYWTQSALKLQLSEPCRDLSWSGSYGSVSHATAFSGQLVDGAGNCGTVFCAPAQSGNVLNGVSLTHLIGTRSCPAPSPVACYVPYEVGVQLVSYTPHRQAVMLMQQCGHLRWLLC